MNYDIASRSIPGFPDQVKGRIQKILFQKQLSSDEQLVPFKIAYFLIDYPTVKTKKIIIMGNFNMNQYSNYIVKGVPIYSQRYRNWQLKVLHYREVVPHSNAGLISFFCSYRFGNLSLRIAKAIVNYYQSDCLQKIYDDPSSLAKINQLDRKTQNRVANEVKKLFNHHELYELFFNHNLPTKVLDVVGQSKLSPTEINTLVRKKTFELVVQFQVSFLDADRIFCVLNPTQKESQYRFSFLLIWILDQECCKTGNTYLRFDEFWAVAQKNPVNISFSDFQQAIIEAEIRKFIKIESTNNTKLCYPHYLYESEHNIINFLDQKIKKWTWPSTLNIETIKTNNPQINDFSFEQKMAIANSINKSVSIISGGPGTGKTTVIKAIIDYLKLHYSHPDPKIVLLAPTGKAAEVMKRKTNYLTQTMHRFIGWEGAEYHTKLVFDKTAFGGGLIDLKNNQIGILIIDEMSMVNTWLLADVLTKTKSFQKVILIGDSNQLPPVEPGSVFNNLVTYRYFPVANLQKVYRHHSDQGHDILKLTALIQTGHLDQINQFFDQLATDSSVKFIEMTNQKLVLKEIGQIYQNWEMEHLKYDEVQVISPMYKPELGVDQINNFLQQKLRTLPAHYRSEGNRFLIGDKVMQIKNREEIKNGEIGIITALNYRSETAAVKVKFYDQQIISYSREELSQLKLAFACTVHKTQGNEFKTTILIVHPKHYRMLTRPLLYTAVTRAQHQITIIGCRQAFLKGINEVPKPRHTGLARLLEKVIQNHQ